MCNKYIKVVEQWLRDKSLGIISAKVALCLPSLGQTWTMFDQVRPGLDEVNQVWANFGQRLAKSRQMLTKRNHYVTRAGRNLIRSNLGQICPTSGQHSATLPESGQKLLSLSHCPTTFGPLFGNCCITSGRSPGSSGVTYWGVWRATSRSLCG